MAPPYTSPLNGGGEYTECAVGVSHHLRLVTSLACVARQELGPDLGGVLAERGDGAVAAWRGVAARGRRGIADDARGRGDVDAAQLRMHREVGGGVDAGKGDVVFRKFLR